MAIRLRKGKSCQRLDNMGLQCLDVRTCFFDRRLGRRERVERSTLEIIGEVMDRIKGVDQPPKRLPE